MDITHPDDRAQGDDLRSRLLANETNPDLLTEGEALRPQGRHHDLGEHVALARAQGVRESRTTSCRSFRTYPTERRWKSASARRSSRPRWASRIPRSTAGIIVVNQKFCDMLGYTREELLTMTSDQIAHPDEQERRPGATGARSAGEIDTYSGEKRYIRKDGSRALGESHRVDRARQRGQTALFHPR